jgi:hypothetical protein
MCFQIHENDDNQDEINLALGVQYIRNWFLFPDPYGPNYKVSFTEFDVSQITLSIVLSVFCLMNMFILKETVYIYASEVLDEGLSKSIDQKID